MRTFIAIELDKQNKDALSKIQEGLKTTGADVKWVKPLDIHLTLKFLGEINPVRERSSLTEVEPLGLKSEAPSRAESTKVHSSRRLKPGDFCEGLKSVAFSNGVNEQKIDKISACLKTTASQTKPFPIILSGMGVFPSSKFPRVVWIGITEGKEALERLAYDIEDLLVGLKFPKEKRAFWPHFTLGRVKSSKNKEALIAKLSHVETDELRQEIKSVVLFKSTLTPAEPIYEELQRFVLSG